MKSDHECLRSYRYIILAKFCHGSTCSSDLEKSLFKKVGLDVNMSKSQKSK